MTGRSQVGENNSAAASTTTSSTGAESLSTADAAHSSDANVIAERGADSVTESTGAAPEPATRARRPSFGRRLSVLFSGKAKDDTEATDTQTGTTSEGAQDAQARFLRERERADALQNEVATEKRKLREMGEQVQLLQNLVQDLSADTLHSSLAEAEKHLQQTRHELEAER